MISKTNQSIVITSIQETELLKIIPQKPLRSSQELEWNGVHFQYHCQPAWETPQFYNSHHAIVAHHSQQTEAESLLDTNRQHQQIVTGDIIIAPANTLNYHIWDREIEFFLLLLDPTYIAQIAYEFIDVDRFEILCCFAKPDPLIYQLCLALDSELKLGGSCSRFFVDHLIAAISTHLIRRYSTKKQLIRDYTDGLSKCKLQRTISYIKDHLTEDLSLKKISSVVEMSPHYFTSLFKQSTGMSAYQYVICCRIELAKNLLNRQDLSLAEVSQEVGFKSQSHFTNAFRKHTGTTPKIYRDIKK
jgi:AraC family transcriptional regulator